MQKEGTLVPLSRNFIPAYLNPSARDSACPKAPSIKPLATCQVTPWCTAFQGPPCPCGQWAQGRSLCWLYQDPVPFRCQGTQTWAATPERTA